MVVELRQAVGDRQKLELPVRLHQLLLQVDDPLGCTNSRHQLVGLERLGDIVVGTEIEAFEFRFLLVFAGEDDDVAIAKVTFLFELAAQLDSVDVGKTPVENGQVPLVLEQELASLRSVDALDDVVPVLLQIEEDQSTDGWVIVHDDDAEFGRRRHVGSEGQSPCHGLSH